MSWSASAAPRVIHSLPGRVRLHLAAWRHRPAEDLEQALARERGVRTVQASPLTGNLLIHFDAALTDVPSLCRAAARLPDGPAASTPRSSDAGVSHESADSPSPPHDNDSASRPPLTTPSARRRQVRVRGLQANPQLGERLIDHLARYPGIQARVDLIAGRLLIDEPITDEELQAVLTAVRSLEVPGLDFERAAGSQGTDNETTQAPTSASLLQSGIRLAGAAAGLLAMSVDAVKGTPRVGPPAAFRAAGLITILQSIPAVQAALHRALGRDAADVALTVPKIAIMTLGGSPLGLAVAALEALHLYTALQEEEEAWEAYEEDIEDAEDESRGSTLRIDAGERVPFAATVVEGVGSVLCDGAEPQPAVPGSSLPPGTTLYGGPFMVMPRPPAPFDAATCPPPPPPSFYERYLQAITPLSLLYIGATALLTRSASRTFASLLLVNSRPATLGVNAAATDAAARVVAAGATMVASRPVRLVRLPRVVLLDSPALLVSGLEIAAATPLDSDLDTAEVINRAAGVSAAAGSPWGTAVFRTAEAVPAEDGGFDGARAAATLEGVRHVLELAAEAELPQALRRRKPGEHVLLLRNEHDGRTLGAVVLRPRLARGVEALIRMCRAHGVDVAVRRTGEPASAQHIARRAGVTLAEGEVIQIIRRRQRAGQRVMYVSASAARGSAFLAADLSVGLTDAAVPFSELPDMLVPALDVLAAVIDTAALHEAVRREAVAASIAANAVGAAWGWWARSDMVAASSLMDSASLATLGWAWVRLRSGQPRPRRRHGMSIADPRPERWGDRSAEDVVRALDTSLDGLTAEEAERRRRSYEEPRLAHPLLEAFQDNLRSPLTAVVAAGTALTLLGGSRADASILALTFAANVGVGTWQEYRVNEIEQALAQREARAARVIRDGRERTIPAADLVPGDLLLVSHGDRIPADARILQADNLEVDEAALTGESFPVTKRAEGGTSSNRVLLEGSDVLMGHGRAVVVAVGPDTRMGATTAAVLARAERRNVLTANLSALFWRMLPVTVVSGAMVTLAGLIRGRPPLGEVLSGGSIALAALPEALPILAGMGQAAAARRLAARNVLLRRPAAIEALGRVDVACVDKTGTLTQGRPAVRLAVTCDGREMDLTREPEPRARRLLRAAAIASPHPDDEAAGRHATDRAVLRAASRNGLGAEIRMARHAESRFQSEAPFHAAVVEGAMFIKGAPEWVAARCVAESIGDHTRALRDDGRARLAARARELAARGLRVLMVARGEAMSSSADDPRELTALGLLGIADPLRETVPEAMRRCQAAGIRVIMLTGDHPATAKEIAREAGMLNGPHNEILTGRDLARLDEDELDQRLEQTAVVARTTPLDKLRIIESLRRRGHAIAMTGDGVNDAPALRLADAGVAIGRSATAVARHTADVILDDDDFANLAEALVEGRSFWRNLQRALALLLGGNVGELAYMAVGSTFGLGASLTVRQILATNLITDALPAFAVVAQGPEHRVLAGLERGGAQALGAPLTAAITRRACATSGPALAAYLLARASGATVMQARSVGFAAIVFTQLTQTLETANARNGRLDTSVAGASALAGGAMLALLTVPRLRTLFGLALPTPLGWALIGASALLAPLVARAPLPGVGGPSRAEADPRRSRP